MNRRPLMLVALAWIGMVSWGLASDPKPLWQKDFSAALQEAEQSQKLLVLHFSAKWCGPCQRMESNVLSRQELGDVLAKKFVAVKVDSDQHPELVRRFGVNTLPSDVFVDPENGRSILLLEGAHDLSGYIASLNRAEKRFQEIQTQRLVLKSSEKPVIAGKTEPQKPVVGLEGFSPIALARKREWVKGSSDHSWDHKGVTYHLSNAEELREFKADPERFAPRLLGCDAVVLFDSDRAVAGSIEYGAFFDDELYFFTSAETRELFKSQPHRYIRTQHVLKVDQIQQQTSMR